MKWRWRKLKKWLDAARRASAYRDALWLIANQGSAMERSDAGMWARDYAYNILNDEPTDSPVPRLRQAVQQYYSWNTKAKTE